MTDVEVAWLAGLLEGEGSFVVFSPRRTDRPTTPIRVRVSVQMTDEDVVRRVQQTVGLGAVWRVGRQKDHHKDSFVWALSSRDQVEQLLHVLRLTMGVRRTVQIDACLAAIAEARNARL